MTLDLPAAPDASPFDSIRLPNDRWSARDLMAAMNYSRWENFLVPLNRAQKAADNLGHAVAHHFLRSQKVAGRPQGGGMTAEDFELTRFAAYLVAMNGDPNKLEVAQAQAYFATKTREAETAQAQAALPDRKALAQMVIAAEEAREIAETRTLELEAKAAADAPKVEAYEQFLEADGTYLVGTVARMLGTSQNKLFRELRDRGVLIAKGAMRNTPYQRYMQHFRVKATSYTHSDGSEGISYTTRVKPSGVDFIRRRLAMTVVAS